MGNWNIDPDHGPSVTGDRRKVGLIFYFLAFRGGTRICSKWVQKLQNQNDGIFHLCCEGESSLLCLYKTSIKHQVYLAYSDSTESSPSLFCEMNLQNVK